MYSRTAFFAFFANRAGRIFNNFRVFNRAAQFDSPRLRQNKCWFFCDLGVFVYGPQNLPISSCLKSPLTIRGDEKMRAAVGGKPLEPEAIGLGEGL